MWRAGHFGTSGATSALPSDHKWKLQSLPARGTGTPPRTGEPDQPMHINATAHPESCQLASPQVIPQRRKDHPYSVLKQHICSLQAKSPERPSQHRTIFQNMQYFTVNSTLNALSQHNRPVLVLSWHSRADLDGGRLRAGGRPASYQNQ